MRSFVRNTVVALLLSAIAAPLMAQDIHPMSSGPERAGFWWGFGLGGAQAKLQCPDCSGPDPDPESFPMGDIHIGMTASPKLTIGLQFSGGSKSDGFFQSPDVTETVGDANVSAYFYPSATGNLWLQGGLAGVVFEAKQGSAKNTIVAGGLTLGLGYDIRVGTNMSITPSIRGVFGAPADIKDQDGNVVSSSKVKVSFIHAGVSLIWH
jgi:hypothetical protein